MGHRTTLKPGRKKKPSRPSLFFIIAMLVALAFLAWGFVVMARRPMVVKPSKALLDGGSAAERLHSEEFLN